MVISQEMGMAHLFLVLSDFSGNALTGVSQMLMFSAYIYDQLLHNKPSRLLIAVRAKNK